MSIPTNLSGKSGNEQVVLNWTAPTQDAGSITSYSVQFKLNSSGSFTTVNTLSTTTSFTVTNLTNNSLYDFQVAAIISSTTGTYTSTISVTSGAPNVPTNFVGVSGTNNQIALTWSLPSSIGGSAITSYSVQYKLSTDSTFTTINTGNTTRSYTLTGLTNGSTYNLQVAATNSQGTGVFTNFITVIPGTPKAPTSLSGTSGNNQIALTWLVPFPNSVSAITSYSVQYKLSTDSTFTMINTGNTTRSYTLTGLTNGLTYNVQVAATNSQGTGVSSNLITVIPGTATAPSIIDATVGNMQVAITWSIPSSTGGSSITSYSVQYKLSTDSSYTTTINTGSTLTPYTVTGLTNGSTYNIRVAATNSNGTGVYSSSFTFTPLTTPDVPTNLSGTIGNQQVALSWIAPTSNGGSSITSYRVQYKLSTDSSFTTINTGNTSTSYTVTSLTNGSIYNFQVAARNSGGTGTYTTAINFTPSTVPDIPTNLSGTIENRQVALSWSAPSSNGGSSITSYSVQYKLSTDSSFTTINTGSTSISYIITGLTNGSTYNIQVAATNSRGTSTYTSAINSIPSTVPNAPSTLSGTIGNRQVALLWSAPSSNGGSDITSYSVQYKLSTDSSFTTINTGSTSISYIITGLTNGSTYDIQVAAINNRGTSTYTSAINSIPSTVPNLPSSFRYVILNITQIQLYWNEPLSNGGNSILSYTINYKLSTETNWTTVNSNNTTLTEIVTVVPDLLYDFEVMATNSNGSSSSATISTSVISCYSKNTYILCYDEINQCDYYKQINQLTTNDLVKIYPSGYRKIKYIGYKLFSNQPSNVWSEQFYTIPVFNNNQFQNLTISGYHSILVDSIPFDIQKKYEEYNCLIKSIHDKKLLIVGLTNFYLTTNELIDQYYHFVLEHENDENYQYGIWANSILSESQSEKDFLHQQFTLL